MAPFKELHALLHEDVNIWVSSSFLKFLFPHPDQWPREIMWQIMDEAESEPLVDGQEWPDFQDKFAASVRSAVELHLRKVVACPVHLRAKRGIEEDCTVDELYASLERNKAQIIRASICIDDFDDVARHMAGGGGPFYVRKDNPNMLWLSVQYDRCNATVRIDATKVDAEIARMRWRKALLWAKVAIAVYAVFERAIRPGGVGMKRAREDYEEQLAMQAA